MLLHSATGLHPHEFNSDRRNNNSIPKTPSNPPAHSKPPRRASNLLISASVVPRPSRPLSAEVIATHSVTNTEHFNEPEADMSEDERLGSNAEGTKSPVSGSKQKRKSKRTSTTYHLAHPAPTLTQKQRLLQIRPKILLQFQRASLGIRPNPVLDVVPSQHVVPRLAKRFPRMFRANAQLGTNDVMILKSEDYDIVDPASDGADSDEEAFAKRDLVAVICQMRRDEGGHLGRAEIVLDDGTVWTASPLLNGLHEFVTIDERGVAITARWVRKPIRNNMEQHPQLNESKFTFSLIDPESRRHPIMASMTQSRLDIPDTYTSVSSSSSKLPPTSLMRTSSIGSERSWIEQGVVARGAPHVIDDKLKTLIQVTATWVALRQGWSPYFQYGDMNPTCNLVNSRIKLRSLSLTRDHCKPSPNIFTRPSTPDSALGTFGSKGMVRRACTNIASPGPPSASPRLERGSFPTRSASAGTAFMQRVSARRFENSPSLMSESENQSEEQLPKAYDVSDNYTNPISMPSSSTERPLFETRGSALWGRHLSTKPQRRVVSALIPRSESGIRALEETPPANTVELSKIKHSTPHGYLHRFKPRRLKAILNYFRRNIHPG